MTDPASARVTGVIAYALGDLGRGCARRWSRQAPGPVDSGVAGLPDTLLNGTTSAGYGWAFNVLPGEVTVSASKSGETFLSHTVAVLPGDNFMGTRLRTVR